MARTRSTPPRWVRWTLGILAALIPCVVWGVTTASADLSLGPHEAIYEVTTDGEVVVDLGPLGTLRIDSPLPVGLGATVTVKEIPADLTAIDQAQTLDALAGDLHSYLQFFGGPQVTIGHVARALVVDAAWRAGFAALVVATAGFCLFRLVGGTRRAELTAALAPRTWEITASVVLVSLLGATLTASAEGRRTGSEPASPVFAGTPLEGARITGRLAGVVNTYGEQLLGLYRESNEFYDQANENLVRAWDRRVSIQALTAPATGGGVSASPTPDLPDGAPSPSADAARDAGGTGDAARDAGGTADARGNADAQRDGDAGARRDGAAGDGDAAGGDDELVTLVLVSDLHCNTGMTPLIHTLATRSGASVVLNAGDTTVNGTAVESFCVDSFVSAVPDGATMVVADGNHDSTQTSSQERAGDVRVLNGKVVEIGGLRILGDRDVLETRIGEGSRIARAETPTEQAERLAEAACDADDGIDLLLVHSPRAGNEGLESGCVPVQISGHTHARSGPEPVGEGVRYISGSTAGAASGQPTVGPLHGTAEMTVLRFDPRERRFVDWQLVEIDPDASARVWPRLAFPAPVPGSADSAIEGDPGESPGEGDPGESPGEGASPTGSGADG